MIWTDHKNVEYIQTAKRCNSRHFFTRFNFLLTYRPESKNTKPDALSPVFDRSDDEWPPEPIIPAVWIVALVMWEIEGVVRKAQQLEPGPGGGPAGCLFVLAGVRSQVLQWGHSSCLTGHPGVHRMLVARVGVRCLRICFCLHGLRP